MDRAGTISGHVTDDGHAVGLADVIALRAAYIDGEYQTVEMVSDRTNDLGEFNLFWLPPGDYFVVALVYDTSSVHAGNLATPDGDDSNSFYAERRSLRAVLNRVTGSGISEGEAHIPVYYPSTSDPLEAAPIRVGPGSEVRGIEIDASPRPTYRVAGRVSGVGADETLRVRLYPLPGRMQISAAQGGSAQILPNGVFEFPGIASGAYRLEAQAGELSARMLVDVRNGGIPNANRRADPLWTRRSPNPHTSAWCSTRTPRKPGVICAVVMAKLVLQ